MLNRISARTLARVATCTAILASAILDARAANELLKYPDLSGQWGRNMLFFEPPAAGPGPVVNSIRKADGTIVARDPCCAPSDNVGDYTNPILKPEAAEAVKKSGDLYVGWYGVGRPAQFVLARAPSLHDVCSIRGANCAAARRGHVCLPPP
jgi:hypothetical protein